jgi:hypothetical protein
MTTADEDNFDIDIYGDGEDHSAENPPTGEAAAAVKEDADDIVIDVEKPNDAKPTNTQSDATAGAADSKMANSTEPDNKPRAIATVGGGRTENTLPKPPPKKQGTKRKGSEDDRPLEPGATNAFTVSDLHWWSTDDDIRGWVNQADCEDELKDITFSEHKVNGKSKG